MKSCIRKLGLVLALVAGAGAVAVSAPVSQAYNPEAVDDLFISEENLSFLPVVPAQATDPDGDGISEVTLDLYRSSGDFLPYGAPDECNATRGVLLRVIDPGTAGFYFDVGDGPVTEFSVNPAFDCNMTQSQNPSGPGYPVTVYGTADGDGEIEAFLTDSAGNILDGFVYDFGREHYAEGTYPIYIQSDVTEEVSVLEAPSSYLMQNGVQVSAANIDLGVSDSLIELEVVKETQDYVFASSGEIDTARAPACTDDEVWVVTFNGTQIANTGVAFVNDDNVERNAAAGSVKKYATADCDTPIPFRMTAAQAGTSSGALRTYLIPAGGALSAQVDRVDHDVVATGVKTLTPPGAGIGGVADGATYIDGAVPNATKLAGETSPISWPRDGTPRCTITGYSAALGTYTATNTCTSFGGSASASATYSVVPDPANVSSLPALDSVSDSTLEQGEPVTVSSGGFVPGETVNVNLYSSPVLLASVVADGSGNASATVTIPADTAVGQHTIVFVSASGAAQGATITVVEPVLGILSGFYDPIDMGAVNTGKANRAFPLKFNLSVDDVQVTDPAAVSVTVSQVDCAWLASFGTDEIEQQFYSELPLKWDGEQFHSNIKIGKGGAGCYVVTASADGADSVSAWFDLT